MSDNLYGDVLRRIGGTIVPAVNLVVDTSYTAVYRVIYIPADFLFNLRPTQPFDRELQIMNRQSASELNSKNLFINLSRDILRTFADYLEPQDLILLSQTCRSLRIFYSDPRCTGPGPAVVQRVRNDRNMTIRFLNALAHDRLDEYACRLCNRMNMVSCADVPSVPLMQICDAIPMPPGAAGTAFWPTMPSLVFMHRHMQLAIKYTRRMLLEDDPDLTGREQRQVTRGGTTSWDTPFTFFHRRFLQRLLAKFTLPVDIDYTDEFGVNGDVDCTFSPKVVKSAEGRFHYVLKSVFSDRAYWRRCHLQCARRRNRHISRTHSVRVCQHAVLEYAYCPGDYGVHEARLALLVPYPVMATTHPQPYGFLPHIVERLVDVDVDVQAGALPFVPPDMYLPPTGSFRSDEVVRDTTELVLVSSCPFCPTDFVRRRGEWHVYQDYGSEVTSAADDAWTVFRQLPGVFFLGHMTPLPPSPNAPEGERVVYAVQAGVYHEPESVYSLYEGIDEKEGDEGGQHGLPVI